MTTTWSVYVELAGGAPPTDEVRDAMTDALIDYRPAVSVENDEHLSVQMLVEARTLKAAIERALAAVTTAHADAGGAGQPVEVHAVPEDVYTQRLLHPIVPKLAALGELAAILGVSKQRAQIVADKFASQLPYVDELGVGRIWLKQTVEHFNRVWERKRTGRPPKPKPEPTDAA